MSSLPLKSNTVVKVGVNSEQPGNAVPKGSSKRRARPVEADKVSGVENGRVRQKKKVTTSNISGDGHITKKPLSETFFLKANSEIEELGHSLLDDDFHEDGTKLIRPETIEEFSHIFKDEAKVSVGSDETLEVSD